MNALPSTLQYFCIIKSMIVSLFILNQFKNELNDRFSNQHFYILQIRIKQATASIESPFGAPRITAFIRFWCIPLIILYNKRGRFQIIS